MYKIEVDPKLFVTCRLCLDEMGQYQIHPNVQAQIKFCYDIDVDPFDGLPQLICKKCETILSDFDEKKKSYQAKQLELKKHPKSNCIVPESLQQQDTVSSTQSAVPETKQKQSFELKLKNGKPPDSNLNDVIQNDDSKAVRTWRKKYNKYFACRFCDSVYKNKKTLIQHKEKHNGWLEKYSHMLKNCKIQLPRIDEKTNFIGCDDMVVMNKDQISVNKYDDYRVFYKRKALQRVDAEKKTISESSDDNICSKRKRKRIRLLSQSSNETVILEDPKKKEEECSSNVIIACVDIDSSDSEQPVPKSETGPKKMISDIIASCLKKFTDKDNHSDGDNFKDIQLQHKILSIGRKVINNKSFNCTGLLRYLENRNLDIEWNPKGSNPESEYVQIRTKVQHSMKDKCEMGWKVASELKDSDSDSYMRSIERILKSDELTPIDEEATLEQLQGVVTHEQSENLLSKLLNTNPVANPKQLPKKTRDVSNKSIPNDINITMPIITNTVSLAEAEVSEKENDQVHTAPFVPRIKVKPVSQLMADKSSIVNETTPAQVAWTIPEYKPLTPNTQNDWVVMHTVELPQTKTLSPFKYFQNLLQMHGINLLDTKQVPSDFMSLIKFKSVFKQETKRVTLSLCLLSDSKQFYIKVTDSTNVQLDVNTLIPTWQWEILSLYKSDIANNILENAKRLGQRMFDSTNYFISLLRSIVFVRP